MKQQAQRATLLTILAVIYLPLTLVTGIFGMNLKESAPRFWACIVGLLVIGGGTAASFFGYRYWRRGHDARQAEELQREAKVYKLA
jgi:zinc transporter